MSSKKQVKKAERKARKAERHAVKARQRMVEARKLAGGGAAAPALTKLAAAGTTAFDGYLVGKAARGDAQAQDLLAKRGRDDLRAYAEHVLASPGYAPGMRAQAAGELARLDGRDAILLEARARRPR